MGDEEPKYVNAAIDKDGDVWGYRQGRWYCLSESSAKLTTIELMGWYDPVQLVRDITAEELASE